MQSAISPFTLHDLRGGRLETCRAMCLVALLADCISVNLHSRPFSSLPLGCWSPGNISLGQENSFH